MLTEEQRTSSEPILNNEPLACGLAAKRADDELIENVRKSSLGLIRVAVIESHLASMPNQLSAASNQQGSSSYKRLNIYIHIIA